MNTATEFQLFRIFQEECTPDDFRQIIRKCVQQATEGDHAARMTILSYALGQPGVCTLKPSTVASAERMQQDSEELVSMLFPAKKTTSKRRK